LGKRKRLAFMITLNIKPVSVNNIYTGRRFLTPEGKSYKKALAYMIPKMNVPDGKLHIRYRFYFSSAGSDTANAEKALTDSIAEKLGFNDNRVYKIEMEKFVVPKGQEKIEFEILPY